MSVSNLLVDNDLELKAGNLVLTEDLQCRAMIADGAGLDSVFKRLIAEEKFDCGGDSEFVGPLTVLDDIQGANIESLGNLDGVQMTINQLAGAEEFAANSLSQFGGYISLAYGGPYSTGARHSLQLTITNIPPVAAGANLTFDIRLNLEGSNSANPRIPSVTLVDVNSVFSGSIVSWNVDPAPAKIIYNLKNVSGALSIAQDIEFLIHSF